METLKNRISNAIESELSRIYDELKINTGDITPEQSLEWDRLTTEFADLFADLIEQNK